MEIMAIWVVTIPQYIRLRAVNGKKISNWSKVKKIKIKK
jgi:hypothetical protein